MSDSRKIGLTLLGILLLLFAVALGGHMIIHGAQHPAQHWWFVAAVGGLGAFVVYPDRVREAAALLLPWKRKP